MNALMGWSLAAAAVSALGCVAVYLWDRWQERRTVVAAETPTQEAPEAAAADTPAEEAPVEETQPRLAVDVPGGPTFVVVLGSKPVCVEELVAMHRFLMRAYGPPLGQHIFFKAIDALVEHESRDLDGELAALTGGAS